MVKRSRITSLLGIISCGMVIIPGILSYSLIPDYSYIILLPGIFIGFLIFPSILCSYFDLKVKKRREGYSSPPERQAMGRVLSLCYGVSFLLLGIILSIPSILTFESILTKLGFLFFSWIIIGILGIVGAIIYRDTPRNQSPDDRLKMRKIGAITLMLSCILLVTTMLLFHINGKYYRTINISQDAYVYEYFPDTNYGQEDQILVGNYEFGKAEAYYLYEISGFSTGWEDAYLEVKFDFASYPVNVGACIIYENWDETSITWNNKPNHTTRYGQILCDGFSFSVPVKPNHFINNTITICLYGIGAESDGFLSGSSKEGALNDDDIPRAVLEHKGIEPNFIIAYFVAYILIFTVTALFLKYTGRFSYPKTRLRTPTNRERLLELERLLERRRIPPFVDRPIPVPRLHPSELYKPREIFKINKLVDLRLIGNRTYIFVNNKRLMVCTFLLINIPTDKVHDYDEIKSIDEAAEVLDKSLERTPPFLFKITPEEEFRAHCSNIQTFFENDLNTDILHTNIAFPLLKELVQQGFEPAKRVFKEEIARRFNEGTNNSRKFLYLQGYLNFLTEEEKQALKGYQEFIKTIPDSAAVLRERLERARGFRHAPVRYANILDAYERQIFVKIVIFGAPNVGKRTISRKILLNFFQITDHDRTIGVEFAVKSMVVNDRRVRLQVWTLTGEERFRWLIPTYFIGAQGVIFIYDITNYSTLTRIDNMLGMIRTNPRIPHNLPILVVGNKSDLSSKRKVSMEEAIKLAKSKGASSYIECSFKTGKNVERMFKRIVQLMLKRFGF